MGIDWLPRARRAMRRAGRGDSERDYLLMMLQYEYLRAYLGLALT